MQLLFIKNMCQISCGSLFCSIIFALLNTVKVIFKVLKLFLNYFDKFIRIWANEKGVRIYSQKL